MQVRLLLEPGQLAPFWARGERLSLALGPHPRSLLLAAGRNLLRADITPPGLCCHAPTLLHQRPEGEAFTTISLLAEVRVIKGDSGHA